MFHDQVLGGMGPAVVVMSTQERNVIPASHFMHCSGCVAHEEFAAKMPRRCVAGDCSNIPEIALHCIPKMWADFVKQKRAMWEPLKNSAICSVHFKPQDFQP